MAILCEFCLLILLSTLVPCHAANILFLNMQNSRSHALSMLPLATSLAHDGHRVTVFSEVLEPGFELNGAVDNVQVKSPNSLAKQIRELFRVTWFVDCKPDRFEIMFQHARFFFSHTINSTCFHQILNTSWDLIIADEMFPHTASIISTNVVERFGTRLALFSTSDLFMTHSMLKSLSRNPVTEPNYYSRLDLLNRHPLSFLCRLITARDALIEQMSVLMLGDRFIKRSANKLAIDTGFSKLFSHSSITFVDYFDKPYWPTAISNSIVFTTPPCDVPQPLSNEIKEFVDDPRSKGTIYMAFGSLVNWATAPDNVIQSFIDAFNSLHDYRIIWTSGEKLPQQLRTHIKTLSWAPQAALLHHNRTKLFITHAGLKSLKESICAGVPIVAVPFFADQMKNSLIAKKLGFAEIIHKRRITSTVVLNTLRLMLEGDSYRERILSSYDFFLGSTTNVVDGDESEWNVGLTSVVVRNGQVLELGWRGRRRGANSMSHYPNRVVCQLPTVWVRRSASKML